MGNLRMPSMANIVISGRMTADPNHSYTPSGTAVARFRIANDQRRGDTKETLFITCCAWGKTADWMAEHARKGSPVLLAGSLEAHSWTKQDGTRAEEIEVNVNTIQLLEWDDNDKPSEATVLPASGRVNESDAIPDDDIPF